MSAAPTVLILAAGQGTRMRSATPKMLHEICGLPMVCWSVRAAQAAGAGRVVVVDSPARALAEALAAEVELVIQPQPNGTGGAVLAAARAIAQDAPVVILSGDVPLVSAAAIEDLLVAHSGARASATMLTTVLEDPSGYGRVVREQGGAVSKVVETKTPGDASASELQITEVNTGIYAFDGKALLEVMPRLSPDNAQGELYLPQTLDLIAAAGGVLAARRVNDERLVLGVNDHVQLARVRAIARRSINERHMQAGVSILDPSNTYIDVDVQIGADTVIEPTTTIKGNSRIGERATVRHSYIIDSVIEDGVSVGPFAYLRPGSVLRGGAKVGTFVEVKNSDIGAGAKVPHLSYIGDADIGAETEPRGGHHHRQL